MDQQVFDFLKDFCSILWEAFPFIVLGSIVAGVLEEVVPQQAITKIIPKNKFLAIGLGGLLGLVFPMCECGIVPVMRRLLRKGLPLGTCIAYMLAGPIVNVVVIASTYVAFQAQPFPAGEAWGINFGILMVCLRVGLGFIIAVTTGLIVDLQYQKYGNKLLTPLAAPQAVESANPLNVLTTPDVHPAELRSGKRVPLFSRLSNISETALHDFIDIMVFLTLGAALAAFAKGNLNNQQVRELSTYYPVLTILAMMGLAVVNVSVQRSRCFRRRQFYHPSPCCQNSVFGAGPHV